MRFTPGVVVHNTSVILYVFIRVEQDPWVGICIVICIPELLDLSSHILHSVLSSHYYTQVVLVGSNEYLSNLSGQFFLSNNLIPVMSSHSSGKLFSSHWTEKYIIS